MTHATKNQAATTFHSSSFRADGSAVDPASWSLEILDYLDGLPTWR